jgi:ribosomal protein S28E/S33
VRESGRVAAVVGVLIIVPLAAAGLHVGRGGSQADPDRTDRIAPQQCRRPYASWSPWNTPLVRPSYDPRLDRKLVGLRDPLTSDPSQYTYPVYDVSAATPRRRVQVDGVYSNVHDGGRTIRLQHGGTFTLPLPTSAKPASGSDGQIVVVDPESGDEWGAWRFDPSGDNVEATNAYHYNTNWSGVPPRTAAGDPFGSRGAGVPYLAGLVRPCELEGGAIRHAVAFAYPYPSPAHVYPATKSDGIGPRDALPEGTRLQLDPTLTRDDLRARGCDDACITIARALQRYGMYVIDNGGRPKVMMEYEATANWDGLVTAGTVSPIPLADFRAVADTTPVVQALPSTGERGRVVSVRYRVFDHGDATRETITFVGGGRRVASLRRPYHVSLSRSPTAVRWQGLPTGAVARFCVRAWDPAGHASRSSCNTLRIR